MTPEFAETFAEAWVDAWNAHDLDRILSHYADDVTVESPMAARLYPQSGGTVAGKNELRNYWAIGLENSPCLRFELLAVLVGVHSLALHLYNTASNRRSVEVMSFNDAGRVCRAVVCFSA